MKQIVLPKKYVAWTMGVGLALFAVHNANQPLIEYAFLPAVGMGLVVVCAAISLKMWKPDNLGPKWVWIPMLVIVASLWLRLIVDFSIDTLAGAVTGILFFCVYLTARILGKDILEAFLPLVIIEALSVIAYGIIWPGIKNGGIITHTGNYDIATGFLILGLVFSAVKHQWWLSALVLVALFFTGADEAIFAVAVLLAVILIRRDWSRKALLPTVALVITIAICTSIGLTGQLYFPTVEKTAMAKEVVEETPVGKALDKVIPDKWLEPINRVEELVKTEEANDPIERASSNRWRTYEWSLQNIKPLGHGLNLTEFQKEKMVHNVPLIIMYQIGIVGAIAWMVIMGYCVVKTRWKYAFVALLALSVLDHFVWTQIGFWWWALVGVATISTGKYCYIEGKVNTVEDANKLVKRACSRGHWAHKVREDGIYVVYGVIPTTPNEVATVSGKKSDLIFKGVKQ